MTHHHLLVLLRTASLVVLAGVLAGCGSNVPQMAETAPPPVSVSQAIVRGDVIDSDQYEGRITSMPKVDLRARVKGHLTKVNFDAGQMVKAGDLLYEIDPRPYKTTLNAALAQAKSAEAALEFANSELSRVRRLVTTRAASREEAEQWVAKQVVAQGDILKAKSAVDEAKLNLDFTQITAPFSGQIGRTQIDLGNLVNAGGGETLLATLVTVDPIYVYFGVDERSLLRYLKDHRNKAADRDKVVKELNIPITIALEGEEGFPHKGTLDFADNRVNPSTGTIQCRGKLSNPDRLFRDGMRARVRVPVSDPYKAILVTERAIGSEQGRKFVYVVNKDNVAERRDVVLDRVVDGLQVVRQGLQPGDLVVVNGIQRVRDGLEVKPKQIPMPDARKSE
jgi:RND family efflux transporter MFP subunit